MSEFGLLCGSAALIQPDALDNFKDAASIESGVLLQLRGRMIVPGSPVGERVFRRLYIVVIHTAGCDFYATPIVDNLTLTALRTHFQRASPQGGEERHTFELPMGITHPLFPNIKVGVCGTAGDALIDVTDPITRFHVEDVYFALEPLNEGRATAPTE